MATITFLNGPHVGKTYSLTKQRTVLGRHPDCDIVIDVGAVSRIHAQVEVEDGEYFVEDLKSRNQTYLNEHPTEGKKKLNAGDRIRVCDVMFGFCLDDSFDWGVKASDWGGDASFVGSGLLMTSGRDSAGIGIRRVPRHMAPEELPPGLQLCERFTVPRSLFSILEWAPNGEMLASTSNDGVVRIWTSRLDRPKVDFREGTARITCLAWSADSVFLAAGWDSGQIIVWNMNTCDVVNRFKAPSGVYGLALAPGNVMLSSYSPDGRLHHWSTKSEEIVHGAHVFPNIVHGLACIDGRIVAPGLCYDTAESDSLVVPAAIEDGFMRTAGWSQNGQTLVLSHPDHSIHIFDNLRERMAETPSHILEGHTKRIRALRFSADGRIVASKAEDGTIRFWRSDAWESLAVLAETTEDRGGFGGVAFHPTEPIIATLGDGDSVIRLWRIDYDVLKEAGSDLRTNDPSERGIPDT